jgi:hypothetical protein
MERFPSDRAKVRRWIQVLDLMEGARAGIGLGEK